MTILLLRVLRTNGRMYGGSGHDIIEAQGDSNYDVWGGSGDDEIRGISESGLDRVFGGSGNDEIFKAVNSQRVVLEMMSSNFFDYGGTAYGDDGNDEYRRRCSIELMEAVEMTN